MLHIICKNKQQQKRKYKFDDHLIKQNNKMNVNIHFNKKKKQNNK